MKNSYFTTITMVVLILIWGFAPKKSDQLNQKQKDQIKIEITEVFDSIMVRFEKLDTEAAMRDYSPNFVAYGVDGNKYSLQKVKEQYIQLFKSATSYKWTTYSLDFVVITKDIVVITVDGKNETIWKSGGKLILDPSHYTFAFEKINGQWKLSYHHFSGTLVK